VKRRVVLVALALAASACAAAVTPGCESVIEALNLAHDDVSLAVDEARQPESNGGEEITKVEISRISRLEARVEEREAAAGREGCL